MRTLARVGEHTGAAAWNRSNTTLCSAISSRFGVFTKGCPEYPASPQPMSSAMMHTIFGRPRERPPAGAKGRHVKPIHPSPVFFRKSRRVVVSVITFFFPYYVDRATPPFRPRPVLLFRVKREDSAGRPHRPPRPGPGNPLLGGQGPCVVAVKEGLFQAFHPAKTVPAPKGLHPDPLPGERPDPSGGCVGRVHGFEVRPRRLEAAGNGSAAPCCGFDTDPQLLHLRLGGRGGEGPSGAVMKADFHGRVVFGPGDGSPLELEVKARAPVPAHGVRSEKEDLRPRPGAHAEGRGVVVFDGVGVIELGRDLHGFITPVRRGAGQEKEQVKQVGHGVHHRAVEHEAAPGVVEAARPGVSVIVRLGSGPKAKGLHPERTPQPAFEDLLLQGRHGRREAPLEPHTHEAAGPVPGLDHAVHLPGRHGDGFLAKHVASVLEGQAGLFAMELVGHGDHRQIGPAAGFVESIEGGKEGHLARFPIGQARRSAGLGVHHCGETRGWSVLHAGLKRIADHVTSRGNGDGVAELIQQLLSGGP